MLSRYTQKIRDWVKGAFQSQKPAVHRGPQTHVIILDGTMSSLKEGLETNAGQTYRLPV